MRSKVYLILIFVLAIMLMGCDSPDDPIDDDNQTTITKFDEKCNEIEQYLNSNISYVIYEDIELISEFSKYNALIEWDSSNYDLIDSDGVVTPDKRKAEVVTLTYTITISNQSKQNSMDVVISPVSIEKIVGRFEDQFNQKISRNYNINDTFYEIFKFEWTSSNEDVFDNNGKYYKPSRDTDFIVYYELKCNNHSLVSNEINLTALGPSDLEMIEEVRDWLKKEGVQDCYLNSSSVLPTYYEPLDIKIEWSSSNNDVVSTDGVITQYVYERYVTLFAKFYLENGSGGTCKFECIVEALDISNMSDLELIENFVSSIALKSYDGVTFVGNAAACNKTYGHLNFYLNEDAVITQMLCPESNKNRTGIKTEVKYIVCHDTGNLSSGADAKANATYCVNSGNPNNSNVTSTGWHYTVGNDGIYQTIPEGEVAYHAHGGASAYATFIKTNVKAIWKKPNISLSDDGYIMFNNIKSDYKVPNPNNPLCTDGPVYQIGIDGYYYISELWESTSFAVNAVKGGNANSIGIESAVNSGSDYLSTCRIFAKLVAEIAIRNDVDLSRVVQHNTTSGKDCPSGMRSTNYWYTFKDMISMEIFAKTYLSQYDFSWSGTGDISDDGKITLNTTAKEVSYSVSVSKDDNVVYNNTYITKLK